TNGSVYTPEIASHLAKLSNTFISISVDGATSEVFEKIRVKGKFDKVVENIQRLFQLRDSNSSPRINLWTVVTTQNLHQLNELVLLAKRLGVDGITFQLFVSNWGKESMDSYTEPIRLGKKSHALKDALDGATQLARQEGVTL